jgi:16S rRNA (cytosine967-C5)-methyltransferase
MSASPARAAAFDILLRVEQEESYASELLHSRHCAELTPEDKGLATELVMGVLRWRSVLDAGIARVSSQKLDRLDLEVLTALRMGAYQLGWLERVPARAAIHESVELVKRARKRSAAPFANAVLRRLADNHPSRNAQEELANAAQDPSVLATAAAHPEWLVGDWCTVFGIEIARRICTYNQRVPVTTIRLRSPDAEEELRREGITLAPASLLNGARRIVSGDVTKTHAFAEDHIVIQDEASQLVAALVGEGSRILDCCAAPGGKTWAVADRNPNATVIAVELHPHRVELLRKRVHARNVQFLHADIRELPVEQRFDRVLVDAPCSGTGTIGRNPEIKWRLVPRDIADLQARQIAILEAAMRHVAKDGKLIYSTCSLQREEGEEVVARVLEANPQFRLLDMGSELKALREKHQMSADAGQELIRASFLRTIPGLQPCDGFFVSALQRFE